jgi:Domain of unknown function (DUF5916)/Carbohydrate family 9 binding domain-like
LLIGVHTRLTQNYRFLEQTPPKSRNLLPMPPRCLHRAIFVLAVIVCFHNRLEAEERSGFQVSRAIVPPKIDGVLDDEVWQQAPLILGDWISYNPLQGEKSAFRTDVRVAYDDRNLYFAFHCFDPEPDKIRTTISRRDNIFNDDWIGFSLDSAATGQTSYHLMVNPSGIQMDALNTTSSGEHWEADFVWDSAGQLTDDGYIVEIRLPLQSIRFAGGSNVKMGILFWRRISRTGVSSSWPDIPPGQWVFNRHAHLLFDELHQPRLIEVLPSITHSITQLRAAQNRWNPWMGDTSVGVSGKYGITSNITLDATINPDFSQVESDAFQVQVNQRFPIFYSEKRPFFMEGMGLFNIAGTGGDGNMRTAVHTRRIVNPAWGSKLTGTAGKVTFGLLDASDKTPQDLDNRGAAIAGKNKIFTIGRATYSLGQSDYIGAIVTDTEHAGRHNRVAGGDLSIRPSSTQQFSATFLKSDTGITPGPAAQGTASQVSYNYNTRRVTSITQVEHYGRDFQMDPAFYNRTGFTSGWTYGELHFYPGEGNQAVVKRIYPFYWSKYGRDQIQNGNERFFMMGIRFNFTRQGYFDIDYGWGLEPWVNQRFKIDRLNSNGNVQLFRWLNLSENFQQGYATYYDPVNPFQGKNLSGSFGITLQPNQHINLNTQYNGVRFDRASNGEHIFTVHTINLQATYQFDKHMRVRAIEQFDSFQHRLLTDLLGMYELVPGTVFYAGYGSLYERPAAQTGTLVPFGNGYLTTSRGLFFKASYLHRF